MSDVRERLAEVLRLHYLWDECDGGDGHIVRCRCDLDNPSITNGVPDGGWMPFAAYFSHMADVLLSLPDIAIVDTAADIEWIADRMADADGGIIYGLLTPDEAEYYQRLARAALLAANAVTT